MTTWREEVELEVFSILTERDICTLMDQKAVCARIANALLPPNIGHYALKAIVAQLEKCDFQCEAGPLRLNTAFIALKELAKI